MSGISYPNYFKIPENLSVSTLTASNHVSASYFYGDGSGLTNLPISTNVSTADNITGSGFSVDPVGIKPNPLFNSVTASNGVLLNNLGNGTTNQYIAVDQLGKIIVTSSLGTSNVLTELCHNVSTTTAIQAFRVVHITGSNSSDVPRISLADWSIEASSSNTLGITPASIAPSSDGLVVVQGIITGVNLTHLTNLENGQILYLSSSGQITNIEPVSPKHNVIVGQIISKASPGSNATIYVSIQNGYELSELHNVSAESAANGDLLSYSSDTSTWKNTKLLTGSYFLTGSLSIGTGSSAVGEYSFASGDSNKALSRCSFVNGTSCQTNSDSSHAEGQGSQTFGPASHAEGLGCETYGSYSHAEGLGSKTYGASSHAGGDSCTTNVNAHSSHAEGFFSQTYGLYSHAEGSECKAYNTSSHAEGYKTITKAPYSHTEGLNLQADGTGSHAEGSGSNSIGHYSHAEGQYTITRGSGSHAEGHGSEADGDFSHAEGYLTNASGAYSHAEGLQTIAVADYQHVQGKYNATSSTALMLIGNGTSPTVTNRKNILEVYNDRVVISGSLYATGQNYSRPNDLIALTQLTSSGGLVSHTIPTGTNFTVINLNSDGIPRLAKTTFIAPPSGMVSIQANFDMTIVNSAAVQMIGLHFSSVSTTTPSEGWYRINADDDASSGQFYAIFNLLNLIPGTSYTYYFMGVCDFTGNTIRASRYQSVAYTPAADLPGPFNIFVYDLGSVSILTNPSS